MFTDSDDSRDCAFCKIARGENPATEIVCQARNWIAFFPLHPATPGHTLIIPRKHVRDLWEAEPSLGCELMVATVNVGRIIEQVLEPEGMNLITSAGATAEQTVFHLHLHIVPRWHRDGFGQIWPTESRFDDANLRGIARGIRRACINLEA